MALNFANGQPAACNLPLDLIAEATEHHLKHLSTDAVSRANVLNYSPADGLAEFKDALAQFLAQDAYSPPSEELVILPGASYAFELVCQVAGQLHPERDVVIMEDPTYFLIEDIFASNGCKVVRVPMDTHGINVGRLEDVLAEYAGRVRMLYTIPVFHNPVGVTMDAETRKRVVALSQAHDFYVVCDDVYQQLYFGAPPPPPVITMDVKENPKVVSVGSFSKLLSPGMRLGWVHARGDMRAALAARPMLVSGGGLCAWQSGVALSALQLGTLQEHVLRLRSAYGVAARTLFQELKDILKEGTSLVTFVQPEGGYFMWVKVNEDVDVGPLVTAMETSGVTVMPGARCAHGTVEAHAFRLCFAHLSVEEISDGAKRIGAVLNQCAGSS